MASELEGIARAKGLPVDEIMGSVPGLQEEVKKKEEVEETGEEEEGKKEEVVAAEEEEEEEEGKREEKGETLGLDGLRQKWVEALEKQYEIPAALVDQLNSEPQVVLPKLLARVHVEAAQSVMQGLATTLKPLVERIVEEVNEKLGLAQKVKERFEGVTKKEAKGVVEKLLSAGFSQREAEAMAASLLEKKGKKPTVRSPFPKNVGAAQKPKKSIWADTEYWGDN